MAGTNLIVIDASVALKWFLIEPDSEKALLFRSELNLHYIPLVPSLFYYEICNVLRYKKEFGIRDVEKVLTTLDKFQFKFEEFKGEFAQKTIKIAYAHGITIYDASYVALAEIAGAKLITADEKLFKKVSERNIILLSQWDNKN
jgi:predicted nucleic acid-binding protein